MTRPGGPLMPGFETVDHPGATVFARTEVVPWARYVLEGGKTLYEAAAQDREAIPLPGREPVYAIPAKGGRGREAETDTGSHDPDPLWAVRHFVRGGLLFPTLLGDRFVRVGPPRPLHELQVSEGARTRGIPTPRIMAAAVYPTTLFYRADLVTAFVPDSSDLVDILFGTRKKGLGGATERLEALRAGGTLIRSMSAAGLRHGDLHAGNILLQWEGTAPISHVLDLDRSNLLPPGVTAPAGPMLNRLKRSLRKWEGRTGLRLTEREWATLEGAAVG